jgi:hydrogenase large subunit
MEVGPLARYIIGYAQGTRRSRSRSTSLLRTDLDLPVEALFSTLGRTAARALEAWAAPRCSYFFDKLIANIKAGDESTANVDNGTLTPGPRRPRASASPRPRAARWATGSSSRRARSRTTMRRADHLERLARATAQGNIGAFEAALLNTPMERPEEPVEILRTLHSFDPCLACSTHVMSPDGDELTKSKSAEAGGNPLVQRHGASRRDGPSGGTDRGACGRRPASARPSEDQGMTDATSDQPIRSTPIHEPPAMTSRSSPDPS